MGRPGKGGCIYENSAVGAKEMLREMQRRLPGFDNGAVGLVMVMDTRRNEGVGASRLENRKRAA
jgi:hypothetical protein